MSKKRIRKEEADLQTRFQIQLLFPNLEEEELWETYKRADEPFEALWACSEILETVKLMMGVAGGGELKDEFVRIRVWDLDLDGPLLWEDRLGAVHGDFYLFEQIARQRTDKSSSTEDADSQSSQPATV